MGYNNGNPYNQQAANKAKSNTKLEAELSTALNFRDKQEGKPGIQAFATNWIEGLRLERANRIGKKK